jgi:CPA2 family monovalent cation:H+ antiporter-2
MNDLSLLSDILIILTTAFVFGYFAGKIKQPPVIGYIAGGAVVAFFGGKLTTQATSTLVDFGVILLMFTLGIEFSFKRLIRVKNIVFLGAISQVVLFSVVFTFILGIFLHIDYFQAVFLALSFSLSSTAIVVKLLFDKGESDTLYGEILTGWLLVQDLLVIPIWILMPAIWQSINAGSTTFIGVFSSVLFAMLKAGFILYLVYWFGKKIVPLYLGKIAKTGERELFLIAVVLLISILGSLVSWAGLSPALGAFFAGLLVSETSQNHAIFAEIRPLRDILSIIFFVSLGLLFNFSFLIANLSLILILVVLAVAFKFVIVGFLMVYFRYHTKTVYLTSLGLITIGEFAFILGRFGLDQQYISVSSYNILLSVSALTMIIGPLAISLGSRSYHLIRNLVRKSSPFAYEKFFTKLDQENKFDEELPFNNHIVICGHGRVGRHISKTLDMADIPYVVVDYNQKVVHELKKHGANVIYGDPSDVEVLDYAQVDKAKVVVVAVPDRHTQEMIIQNSLFLNKNIIIICRSHFDEDRQRLYALGAHAIVQPEFEAAVHMSGVLLNLYKCPKEEISVYLNKIRKEE